MTLIQIGKHLLVIRSIRLLVDVRVCIIYSWQPPFVCTLFRHPKVDPNIFFTSPHLLCEILSLWEEEEKNKLTKLCDEKNSSLTVPPVISIKPIQSDNFVRDYSEQDYLEEQTRMMMMMWWQKRRIFAGEFIKKVANLIKVFLYLSINSYLLPRKHTYSTRKQFVVVLVLFLGTRIGDSSTDEFAIERGRFCSSKIFCCASSVWCYAVITVLLWGDYRRYLFSKPNRQIIFILCINLI